MMNKEEIIKVLNYLDDWRCGYCTDPDAVADAIIYSLKHETPKVRINKQAKEVCIHPICMNPQYKEQLCRKHFIKLKTAQTG